ncbi:MAG: hypothetical protein H8F28_25655 [Fibrella sp.]|nr:hypothetical protein [Armatimonadota bacterium]
MQFKSFVKIVGVLATVCLLSPAFANQTISAVAARNATVMPSGPRTGANGTNFFNVEGSNNGNFSSYGVLDFVSAAFGINETVASVQNLTLNLFNAPAGFSVAGSVNVYLATDVTTSISNVGGASPLRFQGTGEGITNGGQLGILYLLGSGAYVNNGSNAPLTYNLAFGNTAASNLFVNSLNNASVIRIVVTPVQNSVAATYAGVTNSTVASRPRIGFNTIAAAVTVPETNTFALAGLGILPLALVVIRRRKVA